MKKVVNIFLLLLMVSLFGIPEITYSQAPGYRGNRFSVLYRYSTWYIKAQGYNPNNTEFSISDRHSLETNWVLSPRDMVGFGTGIFFSGLNVSGNQSFIKKSYHARITGMIYDIHFRRFQFAFQGHLAPLGQYFGLKIAAIKYGVFDYQGLQTLTRLPVRINHRAKGAVFIEYGQNFIIMNKVIFNFGADAGLTSDIFSKDELRKRMAKSFLLNLNLSIGWADFGF